MQPEWTSLLPPIVTIALAIASRRVLVPLAAGIAVGAILLARRDHQLSDAPLLFVMAIVESITTWSHLQAFVFSLLLGAMVAVLEAGGSMRDLVQRVSRRIRSRRGAQTMIATSGLLIFFDDYANTLLLGGTMRSTVDRYGISRAKLAYLVDSTAAPVAGLAVVSTWAATEITYMADGLRDGGITHASAAFELFLHSIPYRFYPWLALAFVMMIAISGRDFGLMRELEAEAASKRVPLPDESEPEHRWLWLAAVGPVVACICVVAAVLVVTGLSAVPVDERSDRGIRLAGQIFGNGDSYLALVIGGAVGLVTAFALHRLLGKIAWSTLGRGSLQGLAQMMPAMFVLWLAWALSDLTQKEALDTGGYLAGILSARLEPWLLPTVVFVISGAVAFSTGTSWGTMAILTPIAISLALQLDPTAGAEGVICLATSGSVLAGSIFGDHCSPISDTTVLSSRSSGCDHVQHVRSQMPYALVVAAICVVFGTLPAAFGVSPWVSLLFASVAMWLIVRYVGKTPDEMVVIDELIAKDL